MKSTSHASRLLFYCVSLLTVCTSASTVVSSSPNQDPGRRVSLANRTVGVLDATEKILGPLMYTKNRNDPRNPRVRPIHLRTATCHADWVLSTPSWALSWSCWAIMACRATVCPFLRLIRLSSSMTLRVLMHVLQASQQLQQFCTPA